MGRLRTRAAPGFIETERDIADGVRALRRACAVMRRAHDVAGDPPVRRQPGGFPGLARIVVAQQLSAASAAAIWRRLEAGIAPMTATAVLALDDTELRGLGLSGPKVRTLRALATAVDGGLDLDRLPALDDEAIHAALRTVKGIGPWTADIYVMFCLGRADAFAAGDLALQIAAQHAGGLDTRPGPAALHEMAERWRPWRGVAARLLWAYYAAVKSPPSTSAGGVAPGQPA